MSAVPRPQKQNGSLAPAVARSIQLLDILAESTAPMTLAELSRAIGAAKSSTSNLCGVLEENRLIERRAGGFVLGRHVVELGGAYIRGFDQIREFYRLCDESPVLRTELVQIAVLDDTDVLYLARHEGRAPMRLSARIGDRFPAALTAMGNALLAKLELDEVRRRFADYSFPRLTDRSTSSLEELLAKMAEVHDRGYAVDDGGVNSGVFGIAVAVPQLHEGDNRLAIGASLVRDGLRLLRQNAVADELAVLAERLSNPLAITTID